MLLRQCVDTVKIHMRIIDRLQLVVQALCLGKRSVGDGVLRAVFFRQIGKRLALRAQGGNILELPQIDICARRGGQRDLQHVGTGAVGIADMPCGDENAVERIRVCRAEHVLHIESCILRCLSDFFHEARFAAAGSALDHVKKVAAVRLAEILVDRKKAFRRVCAEKIPPYRQKKPSLSENLPIAYAKVPRSVHHAPGQKDSKFN